MGYYNLARGARNMDFDNEPPGHFDTFQICLNGHRITSLAASHPEQRADFCKSCGQPSIMGCQKCKKPIPGYYWAEYGSHAPTSIPNYCDGCGEAFPWLQRNLAALSDLLEVDGLSVADRSALVAYARDLTVETPQTPVAVAKWRRYLETAGKTVVGGIKSILVEIAAEVIKKHLV